MSRLALVLISFALVTACSKSSSDKAAAKGSEPAAKAATPRPATISDAYVAVVEKVIAGFTDLGAAVGKAKGCREMQAAIEAAIPSLQTVGADMKRMSEEVSRDPAAEAWMDANYKDRLKGALVPFMFTAQTCKDDPEFMAVFARMPMIKKKGT